MERVMFFYLDCKNITNKMYIIYNMCDLGIRINGKIIE